LFFRKKAGYCALRGLFKQSVEDLEFVTSELAGLGQEEGYAGDEVGKEKRAKSWTPPKKLDFPV
jgi:hypothetical protein